MSKIRFKKDTQDSLFGNFLYAQVLPKNHFLVQAKDTIPWERFSRKLLKYYKGGGEYGRAAYEPTKILRMLFLSFLYKLSERDTEEFANLHLGGKYFVGLGADEQAPDHSTLTVFKDRIIDAVGLTGYEAIFNEMIRIAIDKGIAFGTVQTIDSVHTVANVNIRKEEHRKTKEGKPPRDPDAAWGVKKVKNVKQEDGSVKEIKQSFYGYKTHVSKNVASGIVTALTIPNGSVSDGSEFQPLVNKDRKLGIVKEGIPVVKDGKMTIEGGTAYTADKAYDDGDNHEFLSVRKLQSAIILKNNRTTTKQEANNAYWQSFKDRPIYEQATHLRYTIEQPFGTAKTQHGFVRCRSLGKTKMAVQSYLTFMVLNLKRILLVKEGIRFRGAAYAYAPIRGSYP